LEPTEPKNSDIFLEDDDEDNLFEDLPAKQTNLTDNWSYQTSQCFVDMSQNGKIKSNLFDMQSQLVSQIIMT